MDGLGHHVLRIWVTAISTFEEGIWKTLHKRNHHRADEQKLGTSFTCRQAPETR
jgi:hypothetical protein